MTTGVIAAQKGVKMTRLEVLTYPWSSKTLCNSFDYIVVREDQLETILDGWLILDDGQFVENPETTELYARRVWLNSIEVFSTTKRINDDRVILINDYPEFENHRFKYCRRH